MKLHVTSPISMLVGFSHTHKRAREDEADVARRTDGANDSDITPLSQPPNSRMRSPRLQEARNALWIGISAHLRRSVQIARWDPKRVARVAATIGAPFVGHHHGAHTVPRQAAWLSQKGWGTKHAPFGRGDGRLCPFARVRTGLQKGSPRVAARMRAPGDGHRHGARRCPRAEKR